MYHLQKDLVFLWCVWMLCAQCVYFNKSFKLSTSIEFESFFEFTHGIDCNYWYWMSKPGLFIHLFLVFQAGFLLFFWDFVGTVSESSSLPPVFPKGFIFYLRFMLSKGFMLSIVSSTFITILSWSITKL